MPYPSALPGAMHHLAQDILPLLYVHRLASTRQLHQLLQPGRKSPNYLRKQLRDLRARGLVAAAPATSRHGQADHLWCLTDAGQAAVEMVGEIPPRRRRILPEVVASQLHAHTLAVVDTGCAFVTWARKKGDECGPLDWDPEIAHRIRDTDARYSDDAFLIPDAVLSYTRHAKVGGDTYVSPRTLFLEIDRATMPVWRLAAKIGNYARYRTYTPSPTRRGRHTPAGREAWRERYPFFPTLLIVLTGAEAGRLEDRASDLAEHTALRLERTPPDFVAGVTTLEQLQQQGPREPIMQPLAGIAGSEPVAVIGPGANEMQGAAA